MHITSSSNSTLIFSFINRNGIRYEIFNLKILKQILNKFIVNKKYFITLN